MTFVGLQDHPLSSFFALAFAISWGGIIVILALHGFDLLPLRPVEGGLLFLMMLLGPSVSGLICTAYLEGRAGLRALWQAALRWQVAPGWTAVALLTAPLLLLMILLGFAAIAGPAFRPGFQPSLLGVGFVAGAFEEIGWTGFATPRLLQRLPTGRSGLLLGLIWAFWHLLVDLRYNLGTLGALWPLEFAVVYLATLTPYRMLITVVYARTQSLGLAILMHASFTGWLMALFPATTTVQSLIWQALFALMLWVLAVAVLTRSGSSTGHTP